MNSLDLALVGNNIYRRSAQLQRPIITLSTKFNDLVIHQLREKMITTLNPGVLEPWTVEISNQKFKIFLVHGCNSMTEFDGTNFGPGSYQQTVFNVFKA